MKKHNGGRPTKYDGGATCAKVDALAQRLRDDYREFLSNCIHAQVADHLGIAESTLYEWAKQHAEFSEALKRWETARNATLPLLAKSLPPAIWIFKAKNMLGWKDAQAVEHSGKVETNDPLIIKVVHVKDGDKGNGNGNGDKKA